jgi:valyl-tRNA synthetase
VAISRPNFVECCAAVTEVLEKQYFELWSALGLSVDWTQTYTTIGKHAVQTSQHAFLELLAKGLIYRTESPTLWDVDFRTAVAQAELEDRDIPGAFHRLRFRAEGDATPIFIETTRPELLPACVALVAHPDDERYQHLFGATALSPLFDVAVPVVAHELAEPGKGSGIAMICTFGDTTDVIWWRELKLELRAIVDKAGRITEEMPHGIVSARGQQAYAQLAGKKMAPARERIVALLTESGELEGTPRPTIHPVKHWENGTKPLEIVTNRQWFIRYPSKSDMMASNCGGCRNTCRRATKTGSTGSWVTGTSPGNGSSVFPSRCGTPLRPTARWHPTGPSWPASRICRLIRPSMFPRVSRPTSATCPVASPPTRMSWTPGRRRR